MSYPPRWLETEERVLAPARFITSMFTCDPCPPHQISLAGFIAHTMNRTQLPDSILSAALVLLHRLHVWNPDHHGSSGHRLFLAAVMVAHKFLCDDPFSNKSWTIVGRALSGINLRQVNLIEQELLGYLGWEVLVSNNDMRMIERELHNTYHHHYLATPPLTPPSTSPLELSPFSLPAPLPSLPSSPPPISLAPSLSSSSSSSASSASSASFPSSPITPSTPLFPHHLPTTKIVDSSSTPFSPTRARKHSLEGSDSSLSPSLMDKFLAAHSAGAFSDRRPRRQRQNAV